MKTYISARKISLMHGPYNAYHAEAFDLIFKLAYHFEKREHPRLEVFLNDDDAKEKEWSTYGTLLDEDDERFASVRFDALGEEREIQISASRFQIRFDKFYSDYLTYPNGSKELMPVYDFLVSHNP